MNTFSCFIKTFLSETAFCGCGWGGLCECMVVKNKKEHQRLLSILFPREFFLVCWSTRCCRAVLSSVIATSHKKLLSP